MAHGGLLLVKATLAISLSVAAQARLQAMLPLFTTNPSRAEIAAHNLFSASGKTSDLGL